MGLFDKLKNVFIEEDEEEYVPPVVVKKEEKVVIEQVKAEEPTPKKETVPVNDNTFSDRELLDVSEKFKFPIIFEDDDFKEERKRTKSINVLEREHTKYEPEVKKEIKTVKKTFKPSPVISPVYGVLDKNYSKDDIGTKDGLVNDYDTKVDIDYVINKAYGEVKTREEKHRNLEDNKIDLFEEKTSVVEVTVNEDVTKEELDEKIKSIDELLNDTADEDFYSLVDSMYKDEGGDEF